MPHASLFGDDMVWFTVLPSRIRETIIVDVVAIHCTYIVPSYKKMKGLAIPLKLYLFFCTHFPSSCYHYPVNRNCSKKTSWTVCCCGGVKRANSWSPVDRSGCQCRKHQWKRVSPESSSGSIFSSSSWCLACILASQHELRSDTVVPCWMLVSGSCYVTGRGMRTETRVTGRGMRTETRSNA